MPSKSISPNEQEMNEIVRLLSHAVDLTPLIKRTVPLGIQPIENGNANRLLKNPSSKNVNSCSLVFTEDAPNPTGFSPSVNQRILPPTFPRFSKIKDRNVSIDFLGECLQRTKQACKIIHCTNYHSALVSCIDNRSRTKAISIYIFLLIFRTTEFLHRFQQEVRHMFAFAQHLTVSVFPATEHSVWRHTSHRCAAWIDQIILCTNSADVSYSVHTERSRQTARRFVF